jgi:drug/metabolite transporter (DMT)-like permease
MSTNAFMLILLAATTHALWNFLAKKTSGGIVFTWMVYTSSTCIFFPFVIGYIDGFNWAADVILICFVSGGLRLFYFLVLQAGYRQADLSVVYPLARGGAPLLTTIAAITILHETPNLYTSLGMVMIVAGVLIITKARFHFPDRRLRTGLLYGLSTAVLIAAYTIWDKLAIERGIAPLALTFASHVFGAVILAPLALKNVVSIKEVFAKEWGSILSISILSPVSYLLVLEAMKTTDVIYVAPAREVSILFGILIGGSLMAEGDTRRRLIAGCFILLGIIVLALSPIDGTDL